MRLLNSNNSFGKERQGVHEVSLLPEISLFSFPISGNNRVLQTPDVRMACSTLSDFPA